MELARLTEEEQKTLHQFEQKLGRVLVAYEPDSTNGNEIPSPEKTNQSLTSAEM